MQSNNSNLHYSDTNDWECIELPEKAPDGPMEQYDQWVANGRLKDDEHQRGRFF